LVVVIWVSLTALAFIVGSEIKENGLKSVVEEIWEGEKDEE
jgi:hypothetical protein